MFFRKTGKTQFIAFFRCSWDWSRFKNLWKLQKWKWRWILLLKSRAVGFNLPVILLLFALYNANVPLPLSLSLSLSLFRILSHIYTHTHSLSLSLSLSSLLVRFPYILSAFWFVWLMSYLTALLVQRNRKQERHTASWLISISAGSKRRQVVSPPSRFFEKWPIDHSTTSYFFSRSFVRALARLLADSAEKLFDLSVSGFLV